MAFEAYSAAHWAGIGAAAAVVTAIIAFRKTLRRPGIHAAAAKGLAAAAILCEGAMLVKRTVEGDWHLYTLPFELCSLMIWLSAAMLLSGNRKLYEITFFLGLLGAMQALLTPDLDETFPAFGYFHFFLGHILIVAANVYMTVVACYRPKLISIWRALGWLHVLAIPAAITDAWAGTNFMFLARKPPTASLLDLLGPWPWYLLQLEVVALLLFMLLLGTVKLMDRLFHASADRTKEALHP